MPLICYQKKKFDQATLKTISTANTILEDYAAQGYDLTLRQLYYQFVSRGIIANKDTEYKRLGSIINDARLAGLIDWDHITDRTRNMRQNSHWNSPQEIIAACSKQFQVDKWKGQANYVEVWVEKDALVGVLEVACQPLDVPYFSCRGYTSQSEMWAASQRLLAKAREGKKVYIIHLGDHDPSGIDMSRDIEDRLSMFMRHHGIRDHMKRYPRPKNESIEDYSMRMEKDISVLQSCVMPMQLNRIALNMNQIEQYNPPPNPAKLTDARSKGYVERFGNESWELDALEPSVITALIQDEVLGLRDDAIWASATAIEDKHKMNLARIAKHYDSIKIH